MRSSERTLLRPPRPRHGPDTRAFTLIELMVVIAIIAIIAAVAIPNLLRARASANEASAISSLRTVVSSQAMFFQSDLENDGDYDYATSLGELDTAGLIDKVLAKGEKSGYIFDLGSPDPFTRWEATAWPLRPLDGLRHFSADQTGIVRFGICGNGIVETGEQCDPAGTQSCSAGLVCSQRCRCQQRMTGLPDDSTPIENTMASLAATRLAMETELRRLAIEALQETNELAAGVALVSTRRVLNRAMVERVMHGLDANGDGRLGFDEFLDADIPALARRLAPRLPGLDFSLAGSEDPVSSVTSAYQQALARGWRQGVSPAQEHPAIDIGSLVAAGATDFLWHVPQPPLVLALQQLHEFVRGLEADPKAVKMVAGTRRENEARKARLEHLIANWPHNLLADDPAGLRGSLENARQRAIEWLSEGTALELTRQIDEALRLLGTG